MKPVRLVPLLAAVLWSAWAAAANLREPIVVEPQQVEIGLFYNGADIEVRAEIPAGYQAAVKITGQAQRLELKRLGKKAGVMWMPVGDIAFEGIPVIYQVLTSAPLRELGSPAVLTQWSLSYDSLVPADSPGADMRSELVRLKEHDGLFGIHEGALLRQGPGTKSADPQTAGFRAAGGAPAAAGPRPTQLLRGSLRLPARVPPGDYTLDLIGFDQQRVMHLGRATLRLEQVGTVRALRRFAMDHGLFYGIAASVIAILVGLLTGLLFRPKSDESH